MDNSGPENKNPDYDFVSTSELSIKTQEGFYLGVPTPSISVSNELYLGSQDVWTCAGHRLLVRLNSGVSSKSLQLVRSKIHGGGGLKRSSARCPNGDSTGRFYPSFITSDLGDHLTHVKRDKPSYERICKLPYQSFQLKQTEFLLCTDLSVSYCRACVTNVNVE